MWQEKKGSVSVKTSEGDIGDIDRLEGRAWEEGIGKGDEAGCTLHILVKSSSQALEAMGGGKERGIRSEGADRPGPGRKGGSERHKRGRVASMPYHVPKGQYRCY